MQSGGERIDYAYDVNGNLINKTMGGLTDVYAYDALGNLSKYEGYDSYIQTYAYSTLGLRTEKQEKGDANRLTLEAMLEGKILESIENDAEASNTDTWIRTSYIQDITQPYAQVLLEKNSSSGDVVYAYGVERLSATNGSLKIEYVNDVRGSVVQWVQNGNIAKSMKYTPFGEQLKDTAVAGYGYNGEMYDVATGMLHLRARQYEPAMNRFSQKDTLRGNKESPSSLNRYAFVQNDPVNFVDPDGRILELFKTIVTLAAGALVTGVVLGAVLEKSKKTSLSNKSTVSSVAGAIIGGAVGAIAGVSLGGAIIGMVTGAVVGGIVSNEIAKQQERARIDNGVTFVNEYTSQHGELTKTQQDILNRAQNTHGMSLSQLQELTKELRALCADLASNVVDAVNNPQNTPKEDLLAQIERQEEVGITSDKYLENAREFIDKLMEYAKQDCAAFIDQSLGPNVRSQTGATSMFRADTEKFLLAYGKVEDIGYENLVPGMTLGKAKDRENLDAFMNQMEDTYVKNGKTYNRIPDESVEHVAIYAGIQRIEYADGTVYEGPCVYEQVGAGDVARVVPLDMSEATGYNIWAWPKGLDYTGEVRHETYIEENKTIPAFADEQYIQH
jgi:RHS repeat-associated core domain